MSVFCPKGFVIPDDPGNPRNRFVDGSSHCVQACRPPFWTSTNYKFLDGAQKYMAPIGFTISFLTIYLWIVKDDRSIVMGLRMRWRRDYLMTNALAMALLWHFGFVIATGGHEDVAKHLCFNNAIPFNQGDAGSSVCLVQSLILDYAFTGFVFSWFSLSLDVYLKIVLRMKSTSKFFYRYVGLIHGSAIVVVIVLAASQQLGSDGATTYCYASRYKSPNKYAMFPIDFIYYAALCLGFILNSLAALKYLLSWASLRTKVTQQNVNVLQQQERQLQGLAGAGFFLPDDFQDFAFVNNGSANANMAPIMFDPGLSSQGLQEILASGDPLMASNFMDPQSGVVFVGGGGAASTSLGNSRQPKMPRLTGWGASARIRSGVVSENNTGLGQPETGTASAQGNNNENNNNDDGENVEPEGIASWRTIMEVLYAPVMAALMCQGMVFLYVLFSRFPIYFQNKTAEESYKTWELCVFVHFDGVSDISWQRPCGVQPSYYARPLSLFMFYFSNLGMYIHSLLVFLVVYRSIFHQKLPHGRSSSGSRRKLPPLWYRLCYGCILLASLPTTLLYTIGYIVWTLWQWVLACLCISSDNQQQIHSLSANSRNSRDPRRRSQPIVNRSGTGTCGGGGGGTIAPPVALAQLLSDAGGAGGGGSHMAPPPPGGVGPVGVGGMVPAHGVLAAANRMLEQSDCDGYGDGDDDDDGQHQLVMYSTHADEKLNNHYNHHNHHGNDNNNSHGRQEQEEDHHSVYKSKSTSGLVMFRSTGGGGAGGSTAKINPDNDKNNHGINNNGINNNGINNNGNVNKVNNIIQEEEGEDDIESSNLGYKEEEDFDFSGPPTTTVGQTGTMVEKPPAVAIRHQDSAGCLVACMRTSV